MWINTEKDTKGAQLLEECLKRHKSEIHFRWAQRAKKIRQWRCIRNIKNYFLIRYLNFLDNFK